MWRLVMDTEHQDLVKKVQNSANHAVKKIKRRKNIKRNETQYRIKRLPHGYYSNPSVRQMYQQMVESLENE